MKNKKKLRLCDIITVAGLLLIIYGFAAAMVITPDKDFSEEENRVLQTSPKFDIDELTSGRFAENIAKYFADQMPSRNLFIGAKAMYETALGRQENNSVLLGSDGYIIAKTDYPSYEAKKDFPSYEKSDANLDYLTRFYGELDGVPLHLAVAGRSQDVLLRYMPSLYPALEVSDRTFSTALRSAGSIPQIDLLTPLRTHANAGEYVYYRTDHHWTTLGAYYAYTAIMQTYGIQPYPLEHFSPETASQEFFGTTWSKAGMKWIAPDTMEFYRYTGDTDMVCEIDGKVLFEGMYDYSYLDKKDKYSAFIGGNNAHVRIYDPSRTDRETLLLIKDSFGHSVAPFLAAHFDLEILDLRYYKPLIDGKPSVKRLISDSGASRVLILYNLDTLLTSESLSALALTE